MEALVRQGLCSIVLERRFSIVRKVVCVFSDVVSVLAWWRCTAIIVCERIDQVGEHIRRTVVHNLQIECLSLSIDWVHIGVANGSSQLDSVSLSSRVWVNQIIALHPERWGIVHSAADLVPDKVSVDAGHVRNL